MENKLQVTKIGSRDKLRVLSIQPRSVHENSMIFVKRQNAALSVHGIELHEFHLSVCGPSWKFFLQLRKLFECVLKFKPMIIHAQYGTLTSLLACLFRFSSKIVVTFRGSDLNLHAAISNTNSARGVFAFLMSQISCLIAHRVICVSQALKNKIWVGKKGAIVIPDGVDLSLFFPSSRTEARNKLGLAEDEKILLFNAGYNPRLKRKDIADAVSAILQSEIPSFRLLLMEGQVEPSLVPIYMQAADCLLMASDSEGSPCVVKEALACNLPIVSVAVGDVREMIAGVSQCYIVEKCPQAIAKKISKVLARLQRSDGQYFASRFDGELASQKLRSLYLSLSKSS